MPAILFFLALYDAVRNKNHRAWLPISIIATFVAFYWRIGGDVLVYHRLWLTTLPMNALIVADLFARLPRAFGGAIAVFAAGAGALAGFGADLDYLRKENKNLESLKNTAFQLKKLPKDTVIAANVVGILTYESDLRMVDMLGLTDAHIARAPGKKIGLPGHEAHDGHYVLEQKPDLIFFAYPYFYPKGAPLEKMMRPMYPPDDDLIADPRLSESYDFVRFHTDDGDLPVYARRIIAR